MLILSEVETGEDLEASLSRRKDANSQLSQGAVSNLCKSIKKEGC